MNVDLRDLAVPLARFFDALGLAAPGPAEYEELTLLRAEKEDLPAASIAGLTLETLNALCAAYGEALRLVFRLADLPLFELRPPAPVEAGAFARFQEDARALPLLTLDLRLDKQALLRGLPGAIGQLELAYLFLFPVTLTNYLQKAALPDLEVLYGSPQAGEPVQPLRLLMPGSDILLEGPLLAIAGGTHVEALRGAPAPADVAARAANCHRVAVKELRWESPWLRLLTPYHLQVASSGFDVRPEARVLRAHLVNILILYLAERTVSGRDGRVSTFAGSTRGVAVHHLSTAGSADVPAGQVRQLFALFEWAYAPEWADGERLALTQIAIVRALADAEPVDRVALLLKSAGGILDELRWSWKELLENRVGEYVEQVQQVENFVSETASAYAGQVNDMVKSLSDTMLAAVGVVIASLLASIFQTPFSASVLRVGLLAYAGYVLAFPLLYNMSNQWSRRAALERDFAFRRARYEQRLLPERVREIMGDEVNVSRTRFERWFWVTAALYLLVIIVTVAAALVAPALIRPATP